MDKPRQTDIDIEELAKSINRMIKRRGIDDATLSALHFHATGEAGDNTPAGLCWERRQVPLPGGGFSYEWVQVPC